MTQPKDAKAFNRGFKAGGRDGLCDALALAEYAPHAMSLEGCAPEFRAGFAAGRKFAATKIRDEIEKRRKEDGQI